MNIVSVKVWGKFACFTMPSFKSTNSISYAVMTPTAACGALENIYWKPEMGYHVFEIHVLRPIRFIDFTTNNLKCFVDPKKSSLSVDSRECRIQKSSQILCDVEYNIYAKITSTDGNIIKHKDQFRRRVNKGQCFRRPYLGLAKFNAHFSNVDPSDHPIRENIELGSILRSVNYETDPISCSFFKAILKNGILIIGEDD